MAINSAAECSLVIPPSRLREAVSILKGLVETGRRFHLVSDNVRGQRRIRLVGPDGTTWACGVNILPVLKAEAVAEAVA